ncbi:hypothetical protein KQI65_09985 [bacterium]|nr:hypothetical protein [bacterium]
MCCQLLRTVAIALFLLTTTAQAQLIPNRGMRAGNGNWMQIPDNSSIAIPVFTVEVWVKSSSGGLIVTRDVTSGTPSDWQLWYEFSRKRLAFITAKSPPDSYFYTADNSFLPDTWYHVALVVNGPAGYAKLYIDGQLAISPTFTSRQFNCNTGLAWCGYYNNSSGAYLDGIIDEARYWNIERTQAQINATKDKDLSNSDKTGLVGWWRFCDSYEDYSGMGNHGTPKGFPQLVLISLPFGITCNENPCDSLNITITGDSEICEGEESILTATPGYASYYWTPTGDTTNTTVGKTPGLYTVEVLDTAGCPGVAYFSLNVRAAPVADAGPDLVLCNSVTGTIGTPPSDPSATYAWSPPDGLTTPDSAQTAVQASTDRRYILRVENRRGCVSFDTVDVRIVPPPILLLPDSLFLCPGSSAPIPLQVTQGLPPFDVVWSPGTGLSATDVLQPIVSPTIPRWYHVVLRDSAGCEVRDSIYVTLRDELDLQLPDSIAICAGNSVRLPLVISNATPPYTIAWTPAASLSDSTVQQPLASPTVATTYHVTVIDSNGCIGEDDILVTTDGELELLLPDTVFVCANASITLPLQLMSATGKVTFRWRPAAGMNDSTKQQPTVTVQFPTTYYVHAVDSLGCEGIDSIRVEVYPTSGIDLSIDGPTVRCIGDSVLLTAAAGYQSYTWRTPTRIIPDTGRTLLATQPGRYSVSVHDTFGCEASSSSIFLTFKPGFTLDIDINGSFPMCEGDSVLLSATSGYRNYRWVDDSGRIVSNTNALVTGRAGSYYVIAEDSTGCSGLSDTIDVAVNPGPNFTIDGPTLVCLNSIHDYNTLLRGSWEYTWTIEDGQAISSTTRDALRVRWTTAGRMQLQLVVVDASTGCSDTLRYPVEVITGIDPDIYTGGPPRICDGDSLLLRSVRSWPIITWTNGDGEIIGSGRSCTVWKEGWYYIHAATADSCRGIDSIFVTVLPAPDPQLTGRLHLCAGDTAVYTLQKGDGSTQWDIPSAAEVLQRDSLQLTLRWLQPGTYTLQVTEHDSTGQLPCSGSAVLEIVVHEIPDAVLTAWPDTVICETDSVILSTGKGEARYIWHTPSGDIGTTAHELRARESGTYTVTVISAGGCEATSIARQITILPAPDPEILGPITVCRNTIATYRLRPQAGNTIRWELAGGIAENTLSEDSLQVQWGGNGAGFVIVIIDNGVCQAVDTLNVTIGDSIRPTISGAAFFCAGSELQLDAGSGYLNYSWTTPDGPASGQVITVRTPGRYTVYVRDAAGCAGSSDPFTVSVYPAPDPEIIGPAQVCPGDTAVLAATPGFVSYRWSDGSTGPYCTMTGTGDRTVTVVDSNGCEATSDPHHVQMHAQPPAPVISRDAMILVSSPATTYQWYRNDSLLPGETGQQCPITFAGTYTVVITDANGCPLASSAFPVDCVAAATIIALPHRVVSPGDTVRIDLSMSEHSCLDAVGANLFTARVRFNKSVLVPLDESLPSTIDAGDRIVEISSSLATLRAGGVYFDAIAALGNRDSIPLLFDAMLWTDAPVAVTLLDGSLRINICREGGDRLFDAEGTARLSQNRPNPFNGATVITYELIERGNAELYILNTLGQRVATLFSGYREEGAYQAMFDASTLASGNYICILRTENIVLHMVMSQIK